jgi:hypothetical protein
MTIYDYQPTVHETPISNNFLLTNFQTVPQPCSNQIPVDQQFYMPYVISGMPQIFNPQLLTSVPVQQPMMNQIPAPTPFTVPMTLPVMGNDGSFLGPGSAASSPASSPSFGPMPVSNTPSPVLGATPPLSQQPLPDVSACEFLFELGIIKHQATVESISQNHAAEIADAMRCILGDNTLNMYVVVTSHDKEMKLTWFVIPGGPQDIETLRQMTMEKDFDKKLICKLAHVGNGEFNKHLHGSKQFSIIMEGRRCFNRLCPALESHNQCKNLLAATDMADQFDTHNVENLFHVCDAPRGMALRGPNVVGGHFRGGDVLRLQQYLDIVESIMGTITRATMIPSMKGKAQYKGWSLYIQTPSAEHVEAIKGACNMCNFEKAEIFQAVDKFNRS